MEISPQSIRYANQVFPIKNIASAQLVERNYKGELTKEATRSSRKTSLGLTIGSGVLAALLLSADSNASYWGIIPILVCIVSFFGCILEADAIDTEYAIELTTNSGKSSLFWTRDEGFADKVRNAIFAALDGNDDARYSVNIDNRTIVDQSVNTSVTNNNIVNDYSINVKHYEGMSEEQMSFFHDNISTALTKIGEAVEKTSQPELVQQLEKLVATLNEEKPEPTKVSKAWNGFKSLCDTYESFDTVGKLVKEYGGLVTAGVAMLQQI